MMPLPPLSLSRSLESVGRMFITNAGMRGYELCFSIQLVQHLTFRGVQGAAEFFGRNSPVIQYLETISPLVLRAFISRSRFRSLVSLKPHEIIADRLQFITGKRSHSTFVNMTLNKLNKSRFFVLMINSLIIYSVTRIRSNRARF